MSALQAKSSSITVVPRRPAAASPRISGVAEQLRLVQPVAAEAVAEVGADEDQRVPEAAPALQCLTEHARQLNTELAQDVRADRRAGGSRRIRR